MNLDFHSLNKNYNFNIQGVIHIGGHHGEEINIYKYFNIKDVIFFEPLDFNFEVLEKNCNNEYDIFKLALGNENKKIKMYVETANLGHSCSMLKPKTVLTQYPHIIFHSEQEVEMMKLDDFLKSFYSKSENSNKKYNFVTIDVQGYELEVFKGAYETLKSIDYIICEINREYLYENCAMVEELDNYLEQFKFKRVETSWVGGTWGDALYVKS